VQVRLDAGVATETVSQTMTLHSKRLSTHPKMQNVHANVMVVGKRRAQPPSSDDTVVPVIVVPNLRVRRTTSSSLSLLLSRVHLCRLEQLTPVTAYVAVSQLLSGPAYLKVPNVENHQIMHRWSIPTPGLY
jgi:hypothetical protein